MFVYSKFLFVEAKKEEIAKMWDEIIQKAEYLAQKEKLLKERETNLELKQKEYDELFNQLNNEKQSFFKGSFTEFDENKGIKSKREIDLMKRTQEFELKQKEFYEKTNRLHDLIKALNTNLRQKSIIDKRFSLDEKNLALLNEQLSCLENSFHCNNILPMNFEGIESEKNDTKSEINLLPNFCKHIDLDAKENSSEINLSREFLSLSRNLEAEEYNYSNKILKKKDNGSMPLQVKKDYDFKMNYLEYF